MMKSIFYNSSSFQDLLATLMRLFFKILKMRTNQQPDIYNIPKLRLGSRERVEVKLRNVINVCLLVRSRFNL